MAQDYRGSLFGGRSENYVGNMMDKGVDYYAKSLDLKPSGMDFGGLGDAISGYFGNRALSKDMKKLGDDILGKGKEIGDASVEASRFQPFSVTSSLGGADVDAQGGYNLNLSEDQQALQDRLFGMAGGFMDELGGDPLERQKALYEQIRAIQSPEEQRQRQALEERLLGQGRLGVMTDLYGGTPEQFAQSLAQGQARNEAFFNAYGQSQDDRQQAYGLASGLMGLGYKPQQELSSLIQTATPLVGFSQSGRESGAELKSEAELAALQAYFESQGLGNAIAGQGGGKSGLFSTLGGAAGTALGGPVGGAIGSALGGLFG